MSDPSWTAWVAGQLEQVRQAGQWRVTRAFDAAGPAGHLTTPGGTSEGFDVVSFASNDYLGLSMHPAVISAAHEAIDRWGTGSTASRLIVGTRPCHEELECELAEWKHAPRALVFSSGYAANVGVLASLGGSDVTVFSDELNHASIIDGCRLGRSKVVVYRHNDIEQLDALLTATPGRKLVVTDVVFSMDGDVVLLDTLASSCVRHGALLVLDEAHAVLGPEVPALDGLEVVRIGTLSKALGSLGGWVVASSSIIDLLVNRARSFIFTTALTPADASAGLAAIRVVRSPDGARLVARLRDTIDRVRNGHPSPIIPVVLGDEGAALRAADALLARGVFVPAIRPPTVPAGTSRLRIALSAAHTDAMVSQLLDALAAQGLAP